MDIILRGQKIHYEQSGSGAQKILCLHGWGCDCSFFEPLMCTIGSSYTVYAVDFPAHGQSEKPKNVWGVDDFAALIAAFIQRLQIAPCILIAHSFGGRVALKLATEHPKLISKMVLTGAAGIRKEKNKEQLKREKRYKTFKKVFSSLEKVPFLGKAGSKGKQILQNKFGSPDYNALDEDMKKTFVRIVSEDLSGLLPLIQQPVLLIWGEKDTETPLWMGEKMEKEIPDAGLVVFENEGHFAYLHQNARFVTIVKVFLSSEEKTQP